MTQSLGHAYPWYVYDCAPGTSWTLVAYADAKRRGLIMQNQSDTVMYVLPWDSDTSAPSGEQPGLYLAANGNNIISDRMSQPPFTAQAIWARCASTGKKLVLAFQSDSTIVEPTAGLSSSSASSESSSSHSASSVSASSATSASSPSSVSASSVSASSESSSRSISSSSSITASLSSASSVSASSVSASSASSASTASTSSYSSATSLSSSDSGP